MPQRPNVLMFPDLADLLSDLSKFKFEDFLMQGNSEPQNGEPFQNDERLAVENFAGSRDSKVFKIAEAINALIEETEYSEALSEEIKDIVDENEALKERVERQAESIADYQGQILELQQGLDLSEGAHRAAHSSEAGFVDLEWRVKELNDLLVRARHTQKILELDLEESQRAYTELKETIAEESPPATVRVGFGEILVYPAQNADADGMPWGLVCERSFSEDEVPPVGCPINLEAGDLFLEFKDTIAITRFIAKLHWLKHYMNEDKK